MIDYENIREKTFEVYSYCNIKSFPINCFSMLKKYGLKYKKYSDLSLRIQDHCHQISEDTFLLNDTIFYKDLINQERIGLSEEAANIAFDDFKRWKRYIVTHNNLMGIADKKLYSHFYNKREKKFIYKKSECSICGKVIYNSFDTYCGICLLPTKINARYDELDRQLLSAENFWLYGVY
ncbi:hypothetical protein [Anaerosporobacter faecicola]|uniref:hypothetical protein n=1 Tax=Anaerosporobacter faecicola TaxID=2718714 RepID=UPI0014397F53|nr:hypothetical protein [Anaerosporobacter faecicola]